MKETVTVGFTPEELYFILVVMDQVPNRAVREWAKEGIRKPFYPVDMQVWEHIRDKFREGDPLTYIKKKTADALRKVHLVPGSPGRIDMEAEVDVKLRPGDIAAIREMLWGSRNMDGLRGLLNEALDSAPRKPATPTRLVIEE